VLAHASETFCFSLLGLSISASKVDKLHMGLIAIVLLLCWIGRAVHVYPLLFLVRADTRHT
jgi:NhaP-type Na+/H+ or K+/H+ antiporter